MGRCDHRSVCPKGPAWALAPEMNKRLVSEAKSGASKEAGAGRPAVLASGQADDRRTPLRTVCHSASVAPWRLAGTLQGPLSLQK